MDKKYVVYQHVTPDNMYYFGQTQNVERRWSNNGAEYKRTALQPYIEKYGWENIQHIVLFRDQTRENALFIENFLIETAREDGVCINKQRSGLISKEEGYQKNQSKQYYEQNKQQIREQHKQYYEENKDKFKEYYEQNKEQIKQYYEENKGKIKQYYEENKQQILEQQKQYREENKEQIREQRRQRYQKNRDKINEQRRQRYQKNRDEILEQRRQRYQRKKQEKQFKELGYIPLF